MVKGKIKSDYFDYEWAIHGLLINPDREIRIPYNKELQKHYKPTVRGYFRTIWGEHKTGLDDIAYYVFRIPWYKSWCTIEFPHPTKGIRRFEKVYIGDVIISHNNYRCEFFAEKSYTIKK